MARKRIIDPEFWSDEEIGKWSFQARLFYIGLWNFADDEGRFKADSRLLKAQIFPYDARISLERLKKELESKIIWYEVNGSQFGFIKNFLKYQRIDRPTKSILPAPLVEDSSSNRRGLKANIIEVNIREDKLIEVKGSKEETRTSSKAPTSKVVQEYFFSKGYPLEEAEKFFNHFEAQNWVTGSGVPITNWRVKAENWHKEESYKILEKKNGSTGKNIGATGDDLRDIINQRAQREVIDSDAPL